MNFLLFIIILILSMMVNSVQITPKACYSLGFDFGTSGVRSCLVDNHKSVVYENDKLWDDIKQGNAASADSWTTVLDLLLRDIPVDFRRNILSICISGTSASALIYDCKSNSVSRSPRMYDYDILQNCENSLSKQTLDIIKSYAPLGSAVHASTSTLAKLISWQLENPLSPTEKLAHQADFVANELLTDRKFSTLPLSFQSDWHNSLKLGYDVMSLEYPNWLLELLRYCNINLDILPTVIEPGKTYNTISKSKAEEYDIPDQCSIVAGTTDSIAAFLATGVSSAGEAVTSLGSTLAIKLLSTVPVQDSSRGIYSHRLGNQWLVGGASNVGCAVLKQLKFSNKELESLSLLINPLELSSLDYYPLTKLGERFPVYDPYKKPILTPVPDSRQEFLHGILQSISRVEKEGYDALTSLGATQPTKIVTCGGGAKNDMWTTMRQHILQIPTSKAISTDASYGAALLAAKYSNTNS